ncbi:hypothetical protein HXX76_014020 [Chlamydomonas incerta]|uniref:Uncharacterized protein n=1 Tax=Chlamydomonas incerta TaxID=51695 RepID=A0A835VTU8_CHLIN|nr:hypothetical protein HXX76_014020 [Chlamydomonas incerta]|eukprot:KAG2425111.1 hypothetical protein HXX76_014020 [Chlamydomonas incerta]
MKHQLWIEIQISITSPPVQQGIPMGPMGPGYGASGGVPATPEQQQQMMLQLMAQQQALLAQMATTAKQQDAAKLPGEV